MQAQPMPGPPYAELHCLTHFSFLRGASHPEELVTRAHELGYAALAITDECSVGGVVRAHVAAKARGLALLIGAELRLVCGLKCVVLATDRQAYGQLCRTITRGRRAAQKGSYHLERSDLESGLAGCLVLLVPEGEPALRAAQWRDDARWLAEAFPGRGFVAVELLRDGLDRARLAALERAAEGLALPLVASGDVHQHARARRRLQDALTAVRLGVPLAEAGWRLLPSGERYLRERARLAKLYPPELLAATLAVAERCRFSLDELRYEYPREIVPPGETAASWLRHLTEEGARRRWPRGPADSVRALIEHELALIGELRYEAYFLTVHDIVAFAKSRGILCQGRGSAANSVVCFCLGVTEVDPARLATLFERFISKERNEPPDIDIDFEHERREEVIQYVYAKYGRERAALAATVITYRPRSALRDLGKALGLESAQTEKLAHAMQWWDGSVIDPERVREAGFDPDNPVLARLLELCRELMGFPRHLSQHVGGFVISAGPLEELVPIENASMPERTVIQWDKNDLDDLGLIKVDLLGLGMLAAIRRALALVADYRRRPFTLADVPPEDPRVYEMVSRADTVGVFQIESRAQMAMLPRLKPRCFYDLVIEVAIVRPGPIQGDMVHPYLRRRTGVEPVSYPSPAVQSVLERTLGVPIFQEQVMQLAIVAAGFSAGEADRLRRAMAAWKRRGGLGHFEERLTRGMRERGYSEAFAQQIFQQILGFGDYGFPECVVGETRVVDADSGRWIRIDDLVAGRACLKHTLACDSDLRLRKRRVLAAVASGVKPVWRLRTALGNSIVASAEHPFMTMAGWQPLCELKTGDYIAAARAVPLKGKRRWPQHQVLVLADLIAEGNLCHPSTFYFYTTESWHCDEFVKAVERFPNTRAVVQRHKSCFSVRVRRIDRRQLSGAVIWTRSLGIWGHGARKKYLPAQVFELCNANIARLLARMWEGDGSFSLTGHASYDTASRQLAEEVLHLLLRLGIVGRLYCRKRTYRGNRIEHFVVTITGQDQLCNFWRRIGRWFIDPKRRRQSRQLAAANKGRMTRDIVPAAVRTLIRRERDAQGLSWREIGQRTGLGMREIQSRATVGKGGFRRDVISCLAEALDSSELRRLASSDVYWDRIVSIEQAGEQPTYDLQIEGDHNFLANNLVVHNSHAASFALLVYSSAWLKCHEPAAFTCALLNSQPMGFYAPAQLVRDARAHGVEVRPVDVGVSGWDCALEERPNGEPALRLGLNLVRSLSQAAALRLIAARERGAFRDVQDLTERAALERRDLEALAAAGALASLTGNRHLAFWDVAGTERPLPLAPALATVAEGRPLLAAPTEGEDIVADYHALGLTLGRHPLALLRERLAAEGLIPAGALAEVRAGAIVRIAGIVITRQRPGSAGGVTFVTVEDETGNVNIIVWKTVAEAQRRVLLESRLLAVEGELQREGLVTHVIARRLTDRSVLLGQLLTRARNFH